MVDLTAKRAELAAQFATQIFEPHWAELAKGGDKLTDRPVAFICDDEVVVIGDDVAKVYAGLTKFQQTAAADWASSPEPQKVLCLAKVKRALAAPPPAEIRVPAQVWNCYLHALAEVGVQVVTSDGTK